MIELLRTDDPVLLSWLEARLAEAGIDAVVFDDLTAGVYGGAIGGLSRRLMVAPRDLPRARRVVDEARNHHDRRGGHV